MTVDADIVGAAVARAGTRDEEFRGFYASTFGDVAGFCLALTSDAAVADELAQEALTQTYVHWPRLRVPRAYAFRVARNLAGRHWRSRSHELATWERLAADAEPPAAGDALVWDAVRRLPPPIRDCVVLHYLYDLRVADVATVVRRPVGTVKRRLHEGRALLASTLEDTR